VNGQYLLFEEGVQPDWKTPALKGGGRWCAEFTGLKGQPGIVPQPMDQANASTGRKGAVPQASVTALWLDLVRALVWCFLFGAVPSPALFN